MVFNAYNDYQQIAYGFSAIILLIYCFLLAHFKPYIANKINKIALMSSSTQIISLVLGMSIQFINKEGFYYKEAIPYIIIIINLLFVMVLMYYSYKEKRI